MAIAYDYPELFDALNKTVPSNIQFFLVGGAVRDILLGREVSDFDFTSEGLVRPIGKKLANYLNGKYYVLNDERDFVRVIFTQKTGAVCHIDISQFSGDSLNEDLLRRDFTINAIAISIRGGEQILVDPLGGASDLRKKRLCMCNMESIREDPLRALRAVRLSAEFNLSMDSALIKELDRSADLLMTSSKERVRDEFFKILQLGRTSLTLGLIQRFNFMEAIFPGYPERYFDKMNRFAGRADHLIEIAIEEFQEEKVSDILSGYCVLFLGKYRQPLRDYFLSLWKNLHQKRELFILSAILLPELEGLDEVQTTQKVMNRLQHLVLSNDEIDTVANAVRFFAIFSSLDHAKPMTDLEMHRLLRENHSAAIEGILLSVLKELTDLETLTNSDPLREILSQGSDLINAYFNRFEEIIEPRPLISGDDILNELNVPAGPIIGHLKEIINEAQVEKLIHTKTEALEMVKKIVNEKNSNSDE